MTFAENPICVALDTPDTDRARELACSLAGHAGMIKVGMELFYRHGAQGYEAVASQGIPVFLDLKLHDIPNTVAAGLNSLLELAPPPAIVNVHATGGPAMLEAAAKAVAGRAKLIAVTILTSLSNDDLVAAGFDPAKKSTDQARDLAVLARDNGADGVVCSPHDIAGIKAACGPEFLTVVPGIRPAGSAACGSKAHSDACGGEKSRCRYYGYWPSDYTGR